MVKRNRDAAIINLGVAQLVARYLGVVEAARSNRVTQTKKKNRQKSLCINGLRRFFFFSFRRVPFFKMPHLVFI